MSSPKLRLAVFASGHGTDLQAIIDACRAADYPAEVSLVVSNNPGAYALERASSSGIPSLIWQRKQFAEDLMYATYMIDKLREFRIDLVCLAGYLKLIPVEVVRAFQRRILNIHPALLPKYGGAGMYGLNVHSAVLAAGERITGVSVHLVDAIYDHGRILAQREVAVQPDDTPETLQQRVLDVEHRLYPEVIAKIAKGEIALDD